MDYLAPAYHDKLREYVDYLEDESLGQLVVNRLKELRDPELAGAVMQLIYGEHPMNPEQLEAFFHNHDENGPLLVLAGAGSGKTHVMTRRIVYLILKGVPVHQIFAVTFTNKAAGEMEERVQEMLVECTRNLSPELQAITRELADEIPDRAWITTFHSACMRLLEMKLPGDDKILLQRYSQEFSDGISLLNPSNQREMLSRMCRRFQVESRMEDDVQGQVDKYRNHLLTPEEAVEAADTSMKQKAANVYSAYQEEKRANRQQDFGDLIFFCAKMARDDEAVQTFLQSKFQHLLIDEYQDTNPAQFILARSMGEEHRRIFAVGDDNQSIYGWRGADVTNIKNFNESFPDSKTVRLVRNYRSKGMILLSANEVFSDDPDAMDKDLKPTQKTDDGNIDYGDKIAIFESRNEQEERKFVCHQIQRLVREEGYSYEDMAIFYRTEEQKFPIKDALRSENIPFQEMGDKRFFTLATTQCFLGTLTVLKALGELSGTQVQFDHTGQLKGATDYLERSLPEWNDSLLNILSGKYGFLDDTEQTLLEHVYNPIRVLFDEELREQTWDRFEPNTRKKLDNFIDGLWEMFTELNEGIHLKETLPKFRDLYGSPTDDEFQNNYRKCKSWVQDHTRYDGLKGLKDFLNTAEKQQQDDQFVPGEEDDQISLMTLHSAKGLEFPVVFFTGLEDGICPHKAPWEDEITDLQEEKRLFYVGITRAEEELFLTYALERTVNKEMQNQKPSRFLELLPDEYVDRRTVEKNWKEKLSDFFS